MDTTEEESPMTRRWMNLLFAIALLALPVAAQTDAPAPETQADEGIARTEDGAVTGNIVLLDAENVIVETDDGDSAFAVTAETTLPAALEQTEDWSVFEGMPVRVSFEPGQPGELRVASSLELLPGEGTSDAGTMAASSTTTEADTTTTAALTDENAPVEPTATDEESELEQDVEAIVASIDETVDEAVQDVDDAIEEDEQIQAALNDANQDIDEAVQDVDDAVEEDEQIQAALNDANQDIDEAVQDADDAIEEDEQIKAALTGDDTGDDVEGQMAAADELPATASPVNWLALVGSLALLGALGVGRLDRHLRWRQALDARQGR
jgi:hypothetical protein